MEDASFFATNTLDQTIGAKVRDLREKASMTERDAATLCGLTLSEYQDGEAGIRRLSSRELFKLCGKLNVSMTVLFRDVGKPAN